MGARRKRRAISCTLLARFRREWPKRDVQIIAAIDQHIEYCTGCFACQRDGRTCVHDDGMRKILEDILDSDLPLFAFRCTATACPRRSRRSLNVPCRCRAWRCGVRGSDMDTSATRFFTPEIPDDLRLRIPEQQNFEPAVAQFKLCFPRNHTVITVLESPMIPEDACAAIVNDGGRAGSDAVKP